MSQYIFFELPKGPPVPLTKASPGLWYWKEDPKSLDFAGAFPTPEPKEKVKKGKTIHFQDPGAKPPDRQTPSVIREMLASRTGIREDKASRPPKRGQHELVTLEDVKYAAMFLANDDETLDIPSFSVVLKCKQLDDFLMALLYYINFFLDKLTLEKKPRHFIGGQPSALEKQEMLETQRKMEVTKKHLAEVYCVLILGLGMADRHHMACGKRKTSASLKDRDFFEGLYNFSSYVAYVAFRHRNLKEIQQEVGRLLRTNIFNPALREKAKQVIKTDVTKELQKSPSPCRKSTGVKQPAIRSVLDKRSPVLSTLLPMAKDSAQYLFQDHYLHPSRTPRSSCPEDLPALSSIVTESKIGIIGAPCSKFSPHTLLPVRTEEEEEEEDQENLRTSSSSLIAQELLISHRDNQGSPSDAPSRATTEADYAENPQ